MQKFILIFTAVILILEVYIYQAFRTVVSNPYVRIGYIGINVLVYLLLFYNLFSFNRAARDANSVQIIATIFLAFLIPKIFIVLFLLIDDLARVGQYAYNRYAHPDTLYPGRRKFLSYLGLGLAALLSLLIIDGEIFGKYRHRVRKVKIKIKNLPDAFKGYKIVQISDLHSGSFRHPDRLKPAFDLINEQEADLVLFTGDLVNNYSEEFLPLLPYFKNIKARDGKFSVLGNHDYGSYGDWKSPAEKAANLTNLGKLQAEAGFRLLNNEHVAIDKNGERLYIIGVENWGLRPFPQYGDLNKATKGIPADGAKILMSHDPTHFDEVVKKHPSDISLTLSGHTHGMQFGLDLRKVRWSPVQYRYKKWADLYESEGKYLYINRGFGVIGYPGRVGVLPEITLFTLS